MYRRGRSTGYSSFSMICSLLLAFVTRLAERSSVAGNRSAVPRDDSVASARQKATEGDRTTFVTTGPH